MWVSIPHMDGMGYTETLNVVTVVQYAAPVEKKEAIVPASIEWNDFGRQCNVKSLIQRIDDLRTSQDWRLYAIDTVLLVQISNYVSRYISMFWQIFNLYQFVHTSKLIYSKTVEYYKASTQVCCKELSWKSYAQWIFLADHAAKKTSKSTLHFPGSCFGSSLAGLNIRDRGRRCSARQACGWGASNLTASIRTPTCANKIWTKKKKKEELHYDSVNVLRACFLHWGSDTLRWIQTQQRDQVLLVLCSCVCVRSIIIGLFANRAAFRGMMGHFHIKENAQNAADAARNNETTPCAAC